MADDREPMALVSLFATPEDEPRARGNFSVEVRPGANESDFIPFAQWEEWEKEQFPKADGGPDPTVLLLQIFKDSNVAAQTCWWVKTSTGKIRVCK